MTPYVADVLTHAGLGTMFACTGACTRMLCKHRLNQLLVGGGFVLMEAAITVKVVG